MTAPRPSLAVRTPRRRARIIGGAVALAHKFTMSL